MMQVRQAQQTTVNARGYLPYPLNPPYFINRTPEYQARVYEYARNYFSPAEMDDLLRLDLFFVPQEAERIKRNLRRKSDFDQENTVHISGNPRNMQRRNAAIAGAQAQAGNLVAPGLNPADAAVRPRPTGNPVDTDLDAFTWDGQGGALPPFLQQPGEAGRSYRGTSLLRRVELFVASMFAFDCAHGLLAHLHEEAISLTSHGTDADETLLKQIIRNIRGYSFRRLVRVQRNNDAAIDVASTPDHAAIPNRRPALQVNNDNANNIIRIKSDPANPAGEQPYRPLRPCFGLDVGNRLRDYTLEDFSTPFSVTELKQLQTLGWIRRDNKFYAPTRYPTALAQYAPGGNYVPRDERLRATNSMAVDASRTMGIYPVSFLTNTTIADDACAARLIEHCTSDRIDPMMFSWGMRRQVFMPLEVDVADIYRFGDLKVYDELHEALNSFSNGLFAGISLEGMWADYLRPRLSQVPTQVPLNQLYKFENVIKHIEIPAVPGEMRHTAGQAEVIRLYNKADDIMRRIDDWFQLGGDFSKVSYDAYRRADPNDPEAIMGNNAHAAGWGERALGVGKCGPGYMPQYFTADPAADPRARRVPRAIVGDDGREYKNPEALVEKCAPEVHQLNGMPPGGADVVVSPRLRTFAAQRRHARSKKRSKARK